ncbi:MAG: diacylglycerol kinase family lipid kinase [Alistipes sp.]|nr:diacylglycerol kinase family lipid kinase [Alistipes sp.]MBQ5899046.1 diacylglycerol kinase family lipid kinase [Alistipes sp.]
MQQTNIENIWYVLVNPVAGWGRGLEDLPLITKLLRENDIPHELVFSQHKHHVTELTVEAVNSGYRHIMVIGGDGTLHEVVNGLFIQQTTPVEEVTVAVIPVGTGNDWIRMYGIPTNYSQAIRAVREGYTLLQDVGEVHYEESQYAQVRYMANVAGTGFDPTVTKIYEHYKAQGRRGKHLYAQGSVKSFFRYKSTGVKVWIDGELVHKDLLFSAAIGIGKYNGGGTQQLPLAVADDGLFDITLYRPMHWWQILFRLRRLFNGDIYSIGHVKHYRGRHVRIESTPEIMVEVDGELLGGTPLEFSIHPRCVRVIVNKDYL